MRRVTVVERDPEVIALFDAIRGAEWPFPNRAAIERGDALTWCSREPVDYLYADIWDRLGSPEAAADMRTMCHNLHPKAAGFWGMEANFVSFLFLARNQCKPPVTRLQFRAWLRQLEVPVAVYGHHAWLSRIPDVATQLIFGGSPGPSAG